jgi:hypothetical protein
VYKTELSIIKVSILNVPEGLIENGILKLETTKLRGFEALGV